MTESVTYNPHGEEFVEEGIVTRTEEGHAFVMVPEKGECEDCSAKIFCTSNTAKMDERTVKVRDPFGVKPGDTVRFVIKGSTVVMAAVFMYGIPFLILVACLFLGMEIFSADKLKELWAFILAVVSLGLYYTLLYVVGKQQKAVQAMPEIRQLVHSV